MRIDEELLKKTRKIAIDMNTSISGLFRGFLADLARREETRREFLADELDHQFGKSTASSNGAAWTRDELHER
jgi:hypothetical protein